MEQCNEDYKDMLEEKDKEIELYKRTVEHDTKEIKLLTAEIDKKDEEIERLLKKKEWFIKALRYIKAMADNELVIVRAEQELNREKE